jgi:hypothetical protein
MPQKPLDEMALLLRAVRRMQFAQDDRHPESLFRVDGGPLLRQTRGAIHAALFDPSMLDLSRLSVGGTR